METKRLWMLGLSVLSLLFLMSAVSAVITLNPSSHSASINQGSSDSFTFTIFSDGVCSAGNCTLVNITAVPSNLVSGSNTLQSSQISITNIPSFVANNTTSSPITVTINVPSAQALGLYTGNITVDGVHNETSGSVATKTISLSITLTPPPSDIPSEVTACTNIGNPGDLRVKDIDLKNLGILVFQESSGAIYLEFGDDNEWFPLDDIEVDIEIENNGDDDVDDIEVEWGIYNTRSKEWVIELEDEKDFNLKDGKDEILEVAFQLEDDLDVDLEDLDDGKHYRFYVTATGTVDNETADETCASDFETAEIIIEGDFATLNNVEFPETVQCNADVQISAKIWNIGDDDQDEVKVEIHNTELGLFHRTIEIGDIDAFDDDVLTFNFRVPSDAEEKTHTLVFSVLDEDNDVYETDFDDDESEFALPFRVEGRCLAESEVSVSASLESGGRAGETLTVRATIINNGDELKTFTVNAAGFTGWASEFSVDRSNLILNAGDSGEVVFTFDVNEGVSGSQSFIIELVSDSQEVITQPVSIAIEGRGGFLGGITGGVISGGNAYLWGIGLINIILVIIIIIVAVRVARR